MKYGKYVHVVHPFEPLYDSSSRILILGSLPSVRSRQQHFYYGHPQNRFWKMLAMLFDEPLPQSIEEKKQLVLRHNLALYDTIYSCDIIGSSDSSIRNVVPSDLSAIISQSRIELIICNGQTSGRCFRKYQEKQLGMSAVILPSTSPANAACSLEKLTEAWGCIRDVL